MKRSTEKTLPNPEQAYVESAILHLRLLQQGDMNGSNAAHDRLISAARKIRQSADRGASFLSNLLSHPEENVRFWAASHLLPLDESVAAKELRDLAASASAWQVQTGAEVTLVEWKNGTLDVDWFMAK